MTIETIPGTRAIASRLVEGERNFEEVLRNFGGVDEETSQRMREWMAKKKLLNRDFGTGRLTVKHGAYLERDVLQRIAAEATKPVTKKGRR